MLKHISSSLLLLLLLAVGAEAQTLNTVNLRLSTGPCTISSSATGPSLVLTGACSSITTSAATNLTLSPTGDLVLGPTGVDVLPNTGYTVNLGALTNKYLTLHAAELWVETLVAQNTIATIGGRILVGPTTTLTSDLASGATTMNVKHNQMSNGDIAYMEANGAVEWIQATTGPSGVGPYTYTITRNLDGSGANNWSAGDAVFNTGTTGKGYIDLYSTSGVFYGSGPTILGIQRTSTTYNGVNTRWAIGNLNGVYGYGADTHGVAFGSATETNVTIDATNGLRMRRNGTTNLVLIDTSGNFTLGDPSGNRLTYVQATGALTIFGANGWGRNQVANSECRVGTESWTYSTNTGLTPTHSFALSPYRLNDISNTCFLTVAGTPTAGQVSEMYDAALDRPVTAGLRYEGSMYLGVHRSGDTTVQIVWYNNASAELSRSTGSVCTAAKAGGTHVEDFCRSFVLATAPANAVNVRLLVRTTHTAEANPYVFMVRAFFGEATLTQTLATEWGPAGLTRITNGLIETDAINARTIAADSITSAKIVAGTIVASDIATGTITADKLSVSTLSAITADLGTVTAGSIDVSSGGNHLWLNACSAVFAIGGATCSSAPLRVGFDGALLITLDITNTNSVLIQNALTVSNAVSFTFLGGTGNASVCTNSAGGIYRGAPG